MNNPAAPVHKRLQLGADTEDVIGTGQYQTVGRVNLLFDGFKIILLKAASLFMSFIASPAGSNTVALEDDGLILCTEGLSPL
ncbi:MAG: hypothetical protein P8Y40_12825, partial [Desulfobacterales bacterium]